MRQSGIGLLIVFILFIVQGLFNGLPTELWLLVLAIVIGTIFIKFEKISTQKDIIKISIFIALFLTVPYYFMFNEGNPEEVNILLTQVFRAISDFLAAYIGLVIPLYLSSRVKKSNKNEETNTIPQAD